MKTTFTTSTRKGNAAGCGFFYLPETEIKNFAKGDEIKVKIDDEIEFFSKIVEANKNFGVYIPKKTFTESSMLDKKIIVCISKADGFYSRVGRDGRIYIPLDLAKKFQLRNDDIICLTGACDKSKITKYCKVNLRQKPTTTEFMCMFDKEFYKKNVLFKFRTTKSEISNTKLEEFIKGMKYSHIDKKALILFTKTKNPVIINKHFGLKEIALYLGAYFSDGTKKGNSWAICASTIEQAKFYVKMHNYLIKNSFPEYTLSITTREENIEKLKSKLRRKWLIDRGIKVNKFRIRKPIGTAYGKTNENGTLIIREHKQTLLQFYNALLNALFREIAAKNDKILAIDFLCGVLEGDGSVNSKTHGHITITTNKDELYMLKIILPFTGIRHKVVEEKSGKYYIRIGALEILRNFDLLKDKIFVLYPKRRRMLFERLQTVGAVKFLLTRNHEPAPWVRLWLKDNYFINEQSNLTQKGKKLRKELIKCIKAAEMA